jgi:hypothetical protein
MYKIQTPMNYSSSAGDRGIFDKRTGTNKTVIINTNNISINPFFDKIGQITDRLVISIKLRSLGGSRFNVAERYYNFSNQINITGFSANVDFLLQVRLIEVKSLIDKIAALAGQKPKIQRRGVLNQFRFRYFVAVDSGINNILPQPASDDLLDLPSSFGQVIKPRDSVF